MRTRGPVADRPAILEFSVCGFESASPPRKRVRNVAVLFADIEGCTRLCEDHADIQRYAGQARLIALEPPIGVEIDLLDFSHTRELIDQGYASAMATLKEQGPG